jgi:hypothetical protein
MPRFQFSVRLLMITIAVVCVALFAWMTIGNLVDVLFATVMWCIIPTPLVVFAIFARGDLQAFAIGGLIPWLVSIGFDTPFVSSYLTMAWLLLVGALCGIMAATVRRWIQWNRWD